MLDPITIKAILAAAVLLSADNDGGRPAWAVKYGELPKTVIRSGAPTVGGNVRAEPEALRAAAEKALRTGGWLQTSEALTLPEYTLARYVTSEVGSGTIEELAAVGEAARNQARAWKLADTDALLLYRQKVGGAYVKWRGWYGPIHGTGTGTSTAPYGRWAATSRDPQVRALMLARGILRGETEDFARGAVSQYGPEYLKDPQGMVRREAADGRYWVGPLPGVDPWHTFLVSTAKSDPQGILLKRGLAALAPGTRAR